MVPGLIDSPIEPFAEHPAALLLFLIFTLGAGLTDLVRGKIYNRWVFPGMCLGFLVQFALFGSRGALNSFLGICLGFGLLLALYLLKILAAGDIKLLMMLGAWGGALYVTRVGLFSLVVGGVMAAISLFVKGRLGSFVKRAFLWLQFFFTKEGPELKEIVDRKLTMPFGVALAISAVWLIYQNPFTGFGILG